MNCYEIDVGGHQVMSMRVSASKSQREQDTKVSIKATQGEIDHAEFIAQFSHMRNGVIRTIVCHMYYVLYMYTYHGYVSCITCGKFFLGISQGISEDPMMIFMISLVVHYKCTTTPKLGVPMKKKHGASMLFSPLEKYIPETELLSGESSEDHIHVQ